VLKADIDSLYFGRLASWDSMIIEDDKKIKYMGRILDEITEISYQISYDEIKLSKIRKEIQSLAGMRFELDELSHSELIDTYDAATDSAIQHLVYFITETPQAPEIPLVSELIYDVRSFDRNVLRRRNDFDDITLALNELIGNNKKGLKALGAQYAEMEAFPVFILYPG